MIPCESRPALSITLLLGLAWAAVNPTAAAAEECPGAPPTSTPIELVLPEGQDTLTCTTSAWWLMEDGGTDYPYSSPTSIIATEHGMMYRGPVYSLSGSGAIEFIVTVEHTPKFEFETHALDIQLFPDAAPTRVYRLVFTDPDEVEIPLRYIATMDGSWEDYWANVKPYAMQYSNQITLSDWVWIALLRHAVPRTKVTITVRRIRTECSMWATVSGDVNDTFYGDVAYFMQGTVDPEMMKILGQWIGDEANKEFEAFLKKELGTPGGDSDGAGGNHFVLTLQDFKIGGGLPSATGDDPAEDPVLGLLGVGDSGTNEALRQVVGILAGQFALGINVTDMTEGPKLERKVQVNEVRATVGARDEGDRIPFDVVDDAELKVFVLPESDAIYGTFSGDLSTRKSYTLPGIKARQLQVHIDANFTALRGQTTCAKR